MQVIAAAASVKDHLCPGGHTIRRPTPRLGSVLYCMAITTGLRSTGTVSRSRAEADEFKRLLVGPARDAMNLAAVRERAQELRKSLDEMARALAFNAHNIQWCEASRDWLAANWWPLAGRQSADAPGGGRLARTFVE